jgi:hypothetical protein
MTEPELPEPGGDPQQAAVNTPAATGTPPGSHTVDATTSTPGPVSTHAESFTVECPP